ncbi:hypothetical protein VNO78_16174 [Psophocarpus tetragonolobus]|uniref:Uncharacterized protein n=1 Tax=Psophocarpus tetragonolobus TaxID=3891 RepID=A0AAN9XK87_PSOTE
MKVMHEVRSSSSELFESTTSGPNFPSPLNGVIIFVVTTLGSYLQVQYGSKKDSPFEEHCMIMWAVSVVLSLYAVMLIAEFTFQIQKHSFLSIIKRFTILMGALVAVLLTIIIMPLFGYFKLLLWTIFFVHATLRTSEEICKCFWEGLCQTIEMVNSYFGRKHTSTLPV